MARLARVVAAGVPHHVTQRGNWWQPTSSVTRTTSCTGRSWQRGVAGTMSRYRAYCLMPNHVHLILVPVEARGLRLALGETR